MRDGRIIIVLFWSAWSALLAGGFVYLGGGTTYAQSFWPRAAGMGALLGVAAALLLLRAWGNRSGMLILGLMFGVLVAALVCFAIFGHL